MEVRKRGGKDDERSRGRGGGEERRGGEEELRGGEETN